MFVLTEIIDCIFFLFSKILSPVGGRMAVGDIVQSFGSKKRGYLESFPGVLKMGNFIDFDVLFPNFNFATSYFCRSRRHSGKMAPKSSFLTISPFRLISR
jgi:hypothetical protein